MAILDSNPTPPPPSFHRKKRTQIGPITRWLLPSLSSFFSLIILYFLILSAKRFLLDSDTGWHIRAGDVMRQTHAVLRHDIFSHTMSGQEWFAWEWLSDVLMSSIHAWRGLSGIVGSAIAILFLSYVGLYRLMIKRGADAMLAGVLIIFAALASMVHWLARPHLFSIAFLVVWYAVLESYHRRRSKVIYLLPIIYVLWANLHGAFIITFPMFVIFILGEWLEFVAQKKQSRSELIKAIKTYAVVAAISFVATLITPYNFRLYRHLWHYLSDDKLLSLIHEFQSPDFHTLDGKLIEVLLMMSAIALYEAFRRRRFVDAGLLILWAHLTLQSERHVALAVIIAVPIIAEHFTSLIKEAVSFLIAEQNSFAQFWRAVRDWYRGILAIDQQLTGASVYLVAFIFSVALIYSANGRNAWADRLLPVQFDTARFPALAVEVVSASIADKSAAFHQQLKGRLFSSDQYGGYVIYRLYPQVKVFVDGRSDFYRQGRVLDDLIGISTLKPETSLLLERYEIQWLLVRKDEPLATWAHANATWQSIYQDATAEVFVRKE